MRSNQSKKQWTKWSKRQLIKTIPLPRNIPQCRFNSSEQESISNISFRLKPMLSSQLTTTTKATLIQNSLFLSSKNSLKKINNSKGSRKKKAPISSLTSTALLLKPKNKTPSGPVLLFQSKRQAKGPSQKQCLLTLSLRKTRAQQISSTN